MHRLRDVRNEEYIFYRVVYHVNLCFVSSLEANRMVLVLTVDLFRSALKNIKLHQMTHDRFRSNCRNLEHIQGGRVIF